jgi:hypothetical protein
MNLTDNELKLIKQIFLILIEVNNKDLQGICEEIVKTVLIKKVCSCIAIKEVTDAVADALVDTDTNKSKKIIKDCIAYAPFENVDKNKMIDFFGL